MCLIPPKPPIESFGLIDKTCPKCGAWYRTSQKNPMPTCSECNPERLDEAWNTFGPEAAK